MSDNFFLTHSKLIKLAETGGNTVVMKYDNDFFINYVDMYVWNDNRRII